LTKSHAARPVAEEIDLQTPGRALWRAKGWILGLAIGAGLATFIGLLMVRPLYTSEARILVQNDESAFTRPTSDQGRDPQQRALDEQALQSQVQVLTSRDLVVAVIKALDLTNNPDFAKDAGTNVVMRFLNRMGLARRSPKEEEKAAKPFAEHLSVFQFTKSSVIGVEYTSGDSGLAANVANKLADVYIDWQREAKLEQTKDATVWLSAQIDVLRKTVGEAEAAAGQGAGLFAGTNNVTLNAQQLSELNSQLILAKAQRDLLESYLARYRDASARHDMGAVPAQATIVSRAHASILPSFPKRGPISLLVAVATALLALAYVLARELIGAPPAPRITRGASGRAERRGPPTLHAPREPATEAPTTTSEAQTAMAPLPKIEKSVVRPVTEASPVEQVELPLATSARASGAGSSASASEPKRPSLLPRRRADEAKGSPPSAKAQAAPSVPEPAKPNAPAGAQSAAGFLERLRRGLAPSGSEPQTVAAPPAEGWLRRMRGARPADKGTGTAKTASATPPIAGNMPVLRTNDLRHYLNQRLTAAAEAANDSVRNGNAVASKTDSDKVGPVLKSLDAVLNHILASGNGGAPRALLVAGASAKVDATAEAISIARALVARREQVVLVDLTCGPAAVSGPLGLPRAPGLTDVAAGRASFEDVVRIDGDTSLQVIAAGNPKLAAEGDENGRFGHVFEALTQAYERVVLHADREAVRKLTPALKFDLPVVVAVLPAGASTSSTNIDLTDFSALGCPVVVYEQSGKEPRSRLLGRVAAI